MNCNHCLKEASKKNCKSCSSSPLKYILTFVISCTDCPELQNPHRFCKPYVYDCSRADKIHEILLAMGVIK